MSEEAIERQRDLEQIQEANAEHLAIGQAIYKRFGEIVSTKSEDNLRAKVGDDSIDAFEKHGYKSRDMRIGGAVKVGSISVIEKDSICMTNDDDALAWAHQHHVPTRTERMIDMAALTEEEQDRLFRYVRRYMPQAYKEKEHIVENDPSRLVTVNADGELVGIADKEPAQGFCVFHDVTTRLNGCKPDDVANAMEEVYGTNPITDLLRGLDFKPVYELPEEDADE